jgi:hypothetical protein
MSFCVTHKVALTLVTSGMPVHWESVRNPNPSGSCPICRGMTDGPEALKLAVDKWVAACQLDPQILTKDSRKDSDNSTNGEEKTMNYQQQKNNSQKIREENNRKVVATLTGGNSIPGNNKRTKKQKPNHLRLV